MRVARARGVVARDAGQVNVLSLERISKRLSARYYPEMYALSVGVPGCTMSCSPCVCPTASPSMAHQCKEQKHDAAYIVEQALSLKNRACIGVAFVQGEPMANWEFVGETARLAHACGLASLAVTNGMASPRVVSELAPLLDAVTVSLRCFSAHGYERLGGNFETVCSAIKAFAGTPSCHLEVATVVVPGLNDSEHEVSAMAHWLASLGSTIPFHLVKPPVNTPGWQEYRLHSERIDKLARIARSYLGDVIVR